MALGEYPPGSLSLNVRLSDIFFVSSARAVFIVFCNFKFSTSRLLFYIFYFSLLHPFIICIPLSPHHIQQHTTHIARTNSALKLC